MNSYSILVVDDEPDNFDVIEALLPSESYRLYYANCGEDAINLLDKFDPDVILLDVMMPGLNGFEVCKRIKLMSQWQGVPIIMVTALSSKEDLARCLAAGADDFLSKPVNGLELSARVNSMVRIKKQYDRIQAFSRLQRNNIHSLANNLNEIRLDLAVGFPNEFNSPLSIIADNIEYLKQNVEHLSLPTTLQLLDTSDRSLTKLHTLTQKFWFYLKLIVEPPVPSNLDISLPRFIIERLLSDRFAEVPMPSNLSYEIESTKIAINEDLAQWIFNELLEYVFARYQDDTYLKISGKIIDNAFHFSLSKRHKNDANSLESDMSDLIKFNSSDDESSELEIGLKIIKKIVEIYDGIFLISNFDREEIEIYVTLPLASENTSMTELQLGSPTIFKQNQN
ncbi:response regulator [Chamaesiphon minutus]|uniref:Response regulator with CheY-like receiver domain and winged-helix DNA-binding domain n=1 Tax=Chamaesiphon minutus (strain ATCC 27169 / PCC 6605) TaxID=1173020 RepID=K9ULJ1_CHAP6|nr:response regulator [Chamaesiphon minutus]AFY95281.1 response regulator with CheY-like receiver domain and winged-helix DNA-binding domain [Chamaesiphon minutus PCC 6605]